MQSFQRVGSISYAAAAAAKLRHAQRIAVDEKHPVEIVGRNEVLFPILDQPTQRIE
ncbi:hypothetical protein D3C75_1108370 [compost metagenome]